MTKTFGQTGVYNDDGLHLSFKGTETLVKRIEVEIQRLMPTTMPTTVCPAPVVMKTEYERVIPTTKSTTVRPTPVLKKREHERVIPTTKTSVRPTPVLKKIEHERVIPTTKSTTFRPAPVPRVKTFRRKSIPLEALTPWWESATSNNRFQMLSINNDEGEDVDDDDYEAMEHVRVQWRTLLTGGGGSNTSDSEDGLEERLYSRYIYNM